MADDPFPARDDWLDSFLMTGIIERQTGVKFIHGGGLTLNETEICYSELEQIVSEPAHQK
jgi:hypothetical protein